MSAAATENKAEFRCTCGRTFAHEISLKRHCWVTGHTADESAPAAAAPVAAAPAVVEEVTAQVAAPIELPNIPTPDAVSEAVRILREKQQAQQAFELRQARERQMRAALDAASTMINQGVQCAAESGRQGLDFARTSLLLALRLMIMLVVCGSLLLAGMGVGRMLAAPAEAESAPAVQRQLAGYSATR